MLTSMNGEPCRPPPRPAYHRWLRRAGVQGSTRVSEVAVESDRTTILSRIIRSRLSYDGTVTGAPIFVILKTGLPDRTGSVWKAGRQEVAFYSEVAAAMAPRLVPRCFEAHWEATTDEWHLLLEDLTDTHVIATIWPLPPTPEQCEQHHATPAPASMRHGGTIRVSASRWEPGATQRPGSILQDLAEHSRASPTAR